VVHVVDPCRALALAGQQEASMAEKAPHSEPQFDQSAPEGRAGKRWRAIKRQQRDGGDQPKKDWRLKFVHVTRHFADNYAPIDLKIAFTESEQRLSKRGDKRPIDVPIDPCQSNEKVLQHLSFSSLQRQNQAGLEPWSADTVTVDLPHKCIPSSCAPEQGNCQLADFNTGATPRLFAGYAEDVSLQTRNFRVEWHLAIKTEHCVTRQSWKHQLIQGPAAITTSVFTNQ